MTSYFDEIAVAAAEEYARLGGATNIDNDKLAEEAFFEYVVRADRLLFEDVTIVTGDREFPNEMREKMMGAFAVWSAFQPGDLEVPEKVRIRVPAFGHSIVAEKMHDLFHDLAGMKIRTRFGTLRDNPKVMRDRRDQHDEKRGI